MLFLILDPAILMLLLYVFAKHEADLNFAKICLICLPMTILVVSATFVVGYLALFLYILFLPIGLNQFLYLRWKTIFSVVGMFMLIRIILLVGLLVLFSTKP